MASISKTANVNLLSNQDENLSKIQQKIREQAKLEIFKTLDLDTRSFTDIGATISELKNVEGDSTKEIKANNKIYTYATLKGTDPFKEIFEKYEGKSDNEKEKMYMEISERIILSNGGVISYKDGDIIGVDTIDENFVKNEYETLNKIDDYKGKLDFFTVKDPDGKLYIIKRTDTELEKITDLENKKMREKLDEFYNDNKYKEEQIKRLREELDKSNKEPLTQPEDESINTGEQTEKEGLTEEDIDKILEEKLKKYLAPLLEAQEKKTKETPENKELNRESVEKNPLYVSRKDVENSVLASRKNSDFPIGSIEIKGNPVKLEEFDFYEEIKQEYISAKGDSVKLAELDKKLAELIILSSPKDVAVEQRYQIQLTHEEIIAGGLVVSQDFLARYGLAVDYFEYTNTIIEKEYQEKLENIQKIEVEMSGLTTSITELSRKINIEGYNDENTLLEIKQKKERQKELRETLRILLLSLASLGNNGIDKLLGKENDLLKEINELNKNKSALDTNIQKLSDEIQKMIEDREGVLRDEFDEKLQSEKGITFDGHTYRYEYKAEPSRNHDKKFIINWIVDGKIKRSETTETNLLPSSDYDGKTDGKWIRNQRETLRQQYIEQNIEFFKLNDDDFKKKKSDLKELKIKQDELNKAIANKEKDLAAIREQIKNKDKKRVVVEEFDDGDKGVHFHDFCEQNGIKRKDGNEIPVVKGMDPDAIYVDKDGRELKLERIKGSNDDGFDNPVTHYELVYYEEVKDKTRVVVENFDDGDKGVHFHDFCEQNGIKRKDGNEIPVVKGMDPDAIYVDKDGRELKLERIKGSNDDGFDNPVTHYELVYYEGGESTGKDAITQQLVLIIAEQDRLEQEIEELEIKLQTEKSEDIRISIEEHIKEVTKELLDVKQKIINITNSTNTYKETITQHRYGVYKVRPIPIPDPIPDLKESFEMTAVLSDMGTDVFREKASLKVEEELKRRYKSLGRWQVGSRLALFLGRGRRRKRMINNEMNNMANTAFQTGAGYSALNEQSQNAADRHEHELNTAMEAINKITTVHNVQVDQLCRDYLNNRITDDQFQDQFNQIIASDANIQNVLNGQNITHIGTNVLLKLQEQKALKNLVDNLDSELNKYNLATTVSQKQIILNNMQNLVERYIKDYQKLPAFMPNFESFVKNRVDVQHNLENYLKHQSGVMKMQIRNLTMNLDILNKGKSAYQIDNKDRETGKGSWKYRLGHLMDKHPRGTALGTTAILVGSGLLTGLIGSAALAGGVSLGVCGAVVGTTNAVKKWTHHTKEQNTHEKNMVTDYRNEQAKIQNWQNQALNGHGRRRYKAKRQLALYDQTTQENIRLSDQITEYITNLSSKVGSLTADEENFMRCNLIEGWARLKYYRQMGHNFLASEQVDKTEKDMKRLEKAITLGLQKIGKTTSDIETNMNATNQLGTNISYNVIQNDLKASYDKSLIQFKRERRNLSLKYGIGTAVASIGVGAFFQWLTGSGMWAGKDVPLTPEVPGTPEMTTRYSSGTDNFALGEYDIDPGHIYSSTKTTLSSSSVPDGSHAVVHYGVGTDIVPVRAGHLDAAELQTQLDAVRDNINAMQWGGRTAQRDAFLGELNKLKYNGFTNDNLATMRAAEELEHYAQGWADSGKDVLIDGFNRGFDASGTTYDSLAERFMRGAIDITTPEVPGIPEVPGKKAVRRGRWFMGLPLFFNTFKDRSDSTDTTDQNRGGNGNGNRRQPNQPQPNPNQPQPNPNQPQPNPNQPNNP